METNKSLKILVISDIHAYAREPDGQGLPSHVRAGDESVISPQYQFIDLIKRESVKADIIICPGDLGDKADSTGIQYAWAYLKRVAEISGARMIVSTVGNHDMDSRSINSEFDPKGLLLSLSPSFPLHVVEGTSQVCEKQTSMHFWAYNFAHFDFLGIRFFILNSSAYHGYGTKTHEELEHGRVSNATLKRFEDYIKANNIETIDAGNERPDVNILLCHHHLSKDGHAEDKDKSEIVGAHALIELLSRTENGRWLVIHGHRHRSRLYQAGPSTGPWILSAASFGATRDRDYDNHSPNQVHLVTLEPRDVSRMAYPVAGTIKTWAWYRQTRGWQADQAPQSGLPPETGFGWRGSLEELAAEIDSKLSEPYLRMDDLKMMVPQLRYVQYFEMQELQKVLADRHSIKSITQQDGSLYQIARME